MAGKLEVMLWRFLFSGLNFFKVCYDRPFREGRSFLLVAVELDQWARWSGLLDSLLLRFCLPTIGCD